MNTPTTDTDTKIWAGRCMDCYNKGKPLQEVTDARLAAPFTIGIKLCAECTATREKEAKADGTCMRPFGITADNETANWMDMRPLSMTLGDSAPQMVKIKFHKPHKLPCKDIKEGGEVRFQLEGNAYWEASEYLDLTIPTIAQQADSLAWFGVRSALTYRFSRVRVTFA